MKKYSLLFVFLFLFMLCGCGKDSVDFSKVEEVKFNNLKLEMPLVFEKDLEYSDDEIIFYDYDDEDNYNNCMFNISISNYPSDDLKEVIQETLLNETDFEYSEKTINGQKWAVVYREESKKYNQSAYVTVYNGKEYALTMDENGDGISDLIY